MHLEYQKLFADNPGLEGRLNSLPGRVFSGKQHPNAECRAVFFCYALPAPAVQDRDRQSEDAQTWTEEAGFTRWYLFDLASEKITDEPGEIIDLIRSRPRRRGNAPSSEKRSPKSAARSTNTSEHVPEAG